MTPKRCEMKLQRTYTAYMYMTDIIRFNVWKQFFLETI
jgi:hypothetical protein